MAPSPSLLIAMSLYISLALPLALFPLPTHSVAAIVSRLNHAAAILSLFKTSYILPPLLTPFLLSLLVQLLGRQAPPNSFCLSRLL
jgi:hypothetical protein